MSLVSRVSNIINKGLVQPTTPTLTQYALWSAYQIYKELQSVMYFGTIYYVKAGKSSTLGIPPSLGVVWDSSENSGVPFASASPNIALITTGNSLTITGVPGYFNYSGTSPCVPIFLSNSVPTTSNVSLSTSTSRLPNNIAPVYNLTYNFNMTFILTISSTVGTLITIPPFSIPVTTYMSDLVYPLFVNVSYIFCPQLKINIIGTMSPIYLPFSITTNCGIASQQNDNTIYMQYGLIPTMPSGVSITIKESATNYSAYVIATLFGY